VYSNYLRNIQIEEEKMNEQKLRSKKLMGIEEKKKKPWQDAPAWTPPEPFPKTKNWRRR